MLFAVLAIIVDVVLGAITPIATFDCTKITTAAQTSEADKEACLAVGYCSWSLSSTGSKCVNDPCIPTVLAPSQTPGTTCTATGTIPYVCAAWYYGKDCNDNYVDRFCQLNDAGNAGMSPSVGVDLCFARSLQAGACDENMCKVLSAPNGAGNYCVSSGAEDCSVYDPEENAKEFCPCLGTANCNLFPGCMLSGSGASATCVPDACYAIVPQTQTACGFGCSLKPVSVGSSATATTAQQICVATSRPDSNSPNQCYFAKWATKSGSSCTGIEESDSICGSTFVLKNGTNKEEYGTPTTTPCNVVNIASGLFSEKLYCSDGRSVPTVSRARVAIPSLIGFLMIVLSGLFTL